MTVNGEKYSYLVYCENANNQLIGDGLFQVSVATKIEILCCGSGRKNISNMFNDCSSLTNLDLSNFNINNVTNMQYMLINVSKKNKLLR